MPENESTGWAVKLGREFRKWWLTVTRYRRWGCSAWLRSCRIKRITPLPLTAALTLLNGWKTCPLHSPIRMSNRWRHPYGADSWELQMVIVASCRHNNCIDSLQLYMRTALLPTLLAFLTCSTSRIHSSVHDACYYKGTPIPLLFFDCKRCCSHCKY